MLSPERRAEIKRKALAEFKRYWILTAYLTVYLTSFTTYRRIILAQHDISYLNYGYSIFEAMVLGKVIMIGEFLGLGDRFRDRPLIYPAVWRAFIFGIFVFCFSFVEVMVMGLIHGESLGSAFHVVWAQNTHDKVALSLVTFVAVIPLFLFNELGLMVGTEKLATVIFRQRNIALSLDPPSPGSTETKQ